MNDLLSSVTLIHVFFYLLAMEEAVLMITETGNAYALKERVVHSASLVSLCTTASCCRFHEQSENKFDHDLKNFK